MRISRAGRTVDPTFTGLGNIATDDGHEKLPQLCPAPLSASVILGHASTDCQRERAVS